jgi:hypothetical protein
MAAFLLSTVTLILTNRIEARPAKSYSVAAYVTSTILIGPAEPATIVGAIPAW